MRVSAASNFKICNKTHSTYIEKTASLKSAIAPEHKIYMYRTQYINKFPLGAIVPLNANVFQGM